MIKIKARMGLYLVVAFLTLLNITVSGQNSDAPDDVTSTYYIQNAIIVTQPGQTINGSILIKDGLIKEVGPLVQIPYDAEIIEADSMYVYAGFIDGMSHTGIPKEDEGKRPDIKDPGNPPNDVAGITPQMLVSDVISPKDKSITSMRNEGFGIAHVAPRGRMMPGKTAVVSLGEGSSEDLILKNEVGLFSQFRSARGVYPATIIGIMAKWRDLHENAKNAASYSKAYSMNPSGLSRPATDKELNALFPIVSGSQPVFFKAQKLLDIHRALTLKKELDFDMVLVDVKQAFPIAGKLKQMNIPVLLSMDLPEKEKEKKEEEKPEEEKKMTKKEVENKALKERKQQSAKEYVAQAVTFSKLGVPFAFSYLSSKPKDIKPNLLRMIEAGLSEDQALAALTTNPARILGISKIAGTVARGKIANLLITDKPYFNEKSKIKYVFVDGKKYQKEEKKKKKKSDSSGEVVNIAGKWSYEVEVPGETQSGSMVISKSNDEYSIIIASIDEPDDEDEATDVEVEGNTATFNLSIVNEGFTMALSFDIEFEGESFKGTVSAGDFGAFPIEGELVDGPK